LGGSFSHFGFFSTKPKGQSPSAPATPPSGGAWPRPWWNGAVLGVLSFVLGVIAGLLAFALSGDGALYGLNRVLDGPARTLMGLVVAWLYFAPLESSRLEQAWVSACSACGSPTSRGDGSLSSGPPAATSASSSPSRPCSSSRTPASALRPSGA